ncbi:MAG: nuclear transport factor 2 family protein [Acidimicrobiia bacterium]
MDDGEQIRALIHAYAERLDGGDLDGVAELFADATWRSEGRPEVVRGVEQVRRMYRGVILYEGRPCTKHVITNISVVSDGIDVATARSYFTVLQATPELPLQPIIAGSYHDEFARVDGEWRFRDRLIIVDLVGDVSRHLRSGEGMPERT